ncbi:HNH endonuclease signature motif containing protein [Rufibacter latericius]|uniref:HNH endonuclease n=1 Tax=Rufibacter latericius TaxID=2487040 RepID=A0A3M9MY16_9BACT|nr:HNH endonuclease signature motif containing protein [Rufibacter latericius]RNI30442.1 HNH endonuclease [Rufibacter latericius]
MKLIDKPKKEVLDILIILKIDTTRKGVIQDIDSVVDILREREALYVKKVDDNTLFEIPREEVISSRVNKAKIISYYEYRILNKPNGREFYDEIILSAPHDICPYCSIRTVKTVDHFLPKSEYPSYSITPTNLVPSCRDCNTDKKISFPTNKKDQTFHPYFDKVDNISWISAELQKTEPLSFLYKVIKPEWWDDTIYDRACCHFEGYNINQLFSNEADRELRGMQHQFKKLHSKDKNLLKAHLLETYDSCLNGLGILDWKTLMYQELSTNEWFLDGCIGVNFFE